MIDKRIWTPALLVAALAVYAVIFSTTGWKKIGVPHMSPGFADLRQLLSSADCARQGHDVYVQNPCDETGRPYTYSSLLLKTMVALRLDPSATLGFGLCIEFFFAAAAACFLAPRNGRQFLLSLIFLSSSAVVLGVERANIDLLLTAGIGLAAIGAATDGAAAWTWLALGLISGTYVKYYPALAVPGLLLALRTRRARIALALGIVAAVALYFIVFPQDIAHIRASTPMPIWYPIEFGAVDLLRIFHPSPSAHAIAIAALPPVVGAAWIAGRRLPPVELLRRDRALLLAGVSMYIFCFFLVSNWEYRRVLLALVLPALLRFGIRPPLAMRALGSTALAVGLTLCWSPFWLRDLVFQPGAANDPWFVTPLIELKVALDWLFVVLIVVCAAASVDGPVSVDEPCPIG